MPIEPEMDVIHGTKELPEIPRTDLFKVFDTYAGRWKKKNTQFSQETEPIVLNFHGEPGIGKSVLHHQLIKRFKDDFPYYPCASVNLQAFQALSYCHESLLRLRLQLGEYHQIPFRFFDVAFSIYYAIANHGKTPDYKDFNIRTDLSFIFEMTSFIKDVPVVGLLPKIKEFLCRGYNDLAQWWATRDTEGLKQLSNLPVDKIESRLPGFFAEDLKRYQNRSGKAAAIFIDSYEFLWGTKRELEKLSLETDDWVRELIAQLPQALFVLTGRNRLRWEEINSDWCNYLLQTGYPHVTREWSEEFLRECEIDNEEIREKVFDASNGVPIYLGVSAQTFHKIKKSREPKPEDFGNTQKEVLARFCRHLTDYEQDTLEVLANPRFWDYTLFKILVDEFKTLYSLNRFDDLHRFSFIYNIDPKYSAAPNDESIIPGKWIMHQLFRDHLWENQKEKRNRIQKFLFNLYNTPLEELNEPKDIQPTHQDDLREAFYHASNIKNIDKLYKWAVPKLKVFDAAAQYQVVLSLYEDLLDLLLKVNDESAQEYIALCYNNIGSALDAQWDYAGALQNYHKALEIFKKVHGESHPSVATSYNNIGEALRAQGDYAGALQYHEKALKIRLEVWGENHPDVAQSYNNIGGALRAQGDYAGALQNYNKAQEINLKVFGENHPSVATNYNNIGSALQAQGDYAGALQNYHKALEIDKKVVGENHPDVAASYNNIGAALQSQGDYAGALKNYNKAQEVNLKVFGEIHPHTASTYNNIGEALRAQGDYAGALENFEKALKIRLEVFGKYHPDVATNYNNIGLALQAQGDYAGALQYYHKALEIDKKVFGENHPDVAIDLNNIAFLFYNAGEAKEALPYAAKAYKIKLKFLGPEHPSTIISRDILIACGGDPAAIEREVPGE